MNTKICKDCVTEKPIEQFVRNSRMKDGRLNSCFDCRKEVLKKYRANRKYKPNREKIKLTKRAYRARHPLRHKANQALWRAILSKKITKMPCEICGNEKSEGHHEDYLKPLDVKWLCKKHHLEAHGGSFSKPALTQQQSA